MEPIDNALDAFDRYLDGLSDEKLDALIAKIDDTGIEGPSVQEYLAITTSSAASFLNSLDESSMHQQVAVCFSDDRLDIGRYRITFTWNALVAKTLHTPVEPTNVYAGIGENNYSQAA